MQTLYMFQDPIKNWLQTRTHTLLLRCHVRQTNPKGELWHFMQQCVSNLPTTTVVAMTVTTTNKLANKFQIGHLRTILSIYHLSLRNNSFFGTKCNGKKKLLHIICRYAFHHHHDDVDDTNNTECRQKWWCDAITRHYRHRCRFSCGFRWLEK